MPEMSHFPSSTVTANSLSNKWFLSWKSKFNITGFWKQFHLEECINSRIMRMDNTILKTGKREKLGHNLILKRGESSHLPSNGAQKGLEECPVFTGDKERQPGVG